MVNNTDQLLTMQQVADKLQVCRRTVMRLVKRGLLPCVRIGSYGHLIRIDPDELAEWLDRHKDGLPPTPNRSAAWREIHRRDRPEYE